MTHQGRAGGGRRDQPSIRRRPGPGLQPVERREHPPPPSVVAVLPTPTTTRRAPVSTAAARHRRRHRPTRRRAASRPVSATQVQADGPQRPRRRQSPSSRARVGTGSACDPAPSPRRKLPPRCSLWSTSRNPGSPSDSGSRTTTAVRLEMLRCQPAAIASTASAAVSVPANRSGATRILTRRSSQVLPPRLTGKAEWKMARDASRNAPRSEAAGQRVKRRE